LPAGTASLCRLHPVTGEPPLTGRLLDLSVLGVGVALPCPVERDTTIVLELNSPSGQDRLLLRARVVRVLPLPGGEQLAGCEFVLPLSYGQLRTLLG
jgi:hypothetical protein